MYNLVVADFFQIVVDQEESIPISTMLEIDRVRKMGVSMMVTTSKGLKSILDYNRDFPFLDYICCFHGAYLYDANEKSSLLEISISPTILEKICKLFSHYEISFFTLDQEKTLFDVNFSCDSIDQVVIHCTSKKELHSVIHSIKRSHLQIKFYQNIVGNQYDLEIVSNECSIFSSVFWLCEEEEIPLSSVVCFGKNREDKEILEHVGIGICMEDGVLDLKKVAQMVTSSNSAKGFERALQQIF